MNPLPSACRLLTVSLFLFASRLSHGQGSLTPPGPPGPTMKTLAQIEPRTPIGSLPFAIRSSGSYYLTTNLVGAAGTSGIAIEVSDVQLDLAGFALSGGGNGNGVQISGGQANVVVRNGTINGWGVGIEGRDATDCRFESLRFVENTGQGLDGGAASTVNSCVASSNGGIGLGVGPHSTLRDSTARANSMHGIVTVVGGRVVNCTSSQNSGTGLTVGDHCLVSDSLFFGNAASGCVAGDDTQINLCKASNNGASGIATGGAAMISRCSTSGNFEIGIRCGNNAQIIECQAVANNQGILGLVSCTVRGCSSLQNSGDGIRVGSQGVVISNTSSDNFLARDAAGIHATGTDNLIQENIVFSNDMGILVDAAGNMVTKNTAANNSLNYRANGTQAIGPIVTGQYSDLTNPIANFDF